MRSAWRIPGGWRAPFWGAAACLASLTAPSPLGAQSYDPTQLRCAAFRQSVDGTVRTELSGKVRLERAGRDGFIMLSAEPGAAGAPFRVSLWWDSLRLWRKADGTDLAPDAEGLLGGRYTGTLDGRGDYRGERVPFIPDEVAEIADLTGVPDDLLPLLPPDPLGVGGSWGDGDGRTVRRLADSVDAGRHWWRYAIERRTEHRERRPVGGGGDATIQDSEAETGQLTWDPALGPWRWDRHVVADTRIVEDPRRAFRSHLEQRVVLQRVKADSGACEVR